MPQERPERREKRRRTALKTSWRAHAKERAHQQAEIQSTGMYQQPFANIVVTPQVHSAHPPCFVEVSARTFQSLAALTQEPLSTCTANPSPVAVHGVTGFRMVLPVAAPAIRFGDVTPHADRFEVDHHLITVIALVADDFFDLTVGDDRLHLFGGVDQRVDARRRVACIRILHGDGDDSTGLQIHRVLRLVRQVRPPVLHLRDFRVGIERMSPIVIRALLRAFSVEARQILARGRVDARRLRELHQEFLIAGARVAPHDAAQRRVRFQRRRVNADRLAFDQARVGEPLQDPREDRFVRFQIDQPTRPRNRRMIWRRLRQHEAEKLAEGKRIRRTPCDRALGVQAFEVADQQQPKIPSRGQTWPTDLVSVKSLTERLDVGIEFGVVQNLIQSRVEGVRGGAWQILSRDPHRRLLRTPPSFAHRHARV